MNHENPSQDLSRCKPDDTIARIKPKQEKSKTNQIKNQTNSRLKPKENNNLTSDKSLHKSLHNSLYNSLYNDIIHCVCDDILILIVMKKCIAKNRGQEYPLFRKSTKFSILKVLSILSELFLPVLLFSLFSARIK